CAPSARPARRAGGVPEHPRRLLPSRLRRGVRLGHRAAVPPDHQVIRCPHRHSRNRHRPVPAVVRPGRRAASSRLTKENPVLWYIARRLLQMIPVFLGATLIVYLMAFYTSGDPILALAGDKPISPAVEQQLREQYNLDEHVVVQWLLYLKSVLTFDLGVGFNGRPIMDQIAAAFPTTAKLAIIAVVVESLFGVIAGVISGLRKGKLIDTTLLMLSLLLIATPTFV